MIRKKFKMSRRVGEAIWGCKKDSFNKKSYPPGIHGGVGYKRSTEFGNQLLFKQKIKTYYGNISEKQFLSLFYKAKKMKGNTGENLLSIIETRLDAFLYRSGLVKSIFESKQIISHNHVIVNKKIINIISFNLKPLDIVSIRSSFDYTIHVKSFSYIKTNIKSKSAILLKIPHISEIYYPLDIRPRMIVEFYSR